MFIYFVPQALTENMNRNINDLSTLQLLNQKLRLLRDSLFAKKAPRQNYLMPNSNPEAQMTSSRQIFIDPASKTVSIQSQGKPSIVVKSRSRSNIHLRIRHKPGKKINLLIGSKNPYGARGRRVLLRTSGNARIHFMKNGGKNILIQKPVFLNAAAPSFQTQVDSSVQIPVPTTQRMHSIGTTHPTNILQHIASNTAPTNPMTIPTTTMIPEEIETEEPEVP